MDENRCAMNRYFQVERVYKRTRVKICGITNMADAMFAVAAGADAIGMVFYEKSPRAISMNVARQIANKLPPFVNCVGLFVDATEYRIREVLGEVAIDTIQFHGQETEQACILYGKPYIKAIRMAQNIDLPDQVENYSSAKALLLDTFVENRPGGTGQAFDWQRIPETFKKPIILAGGLNAGNVKQAISEVQPYAVDVSSGVESEAGKKDPNKIINFISETMNGTAR